MYQHAENSLAAWSTWQRLAFLFELVIPVDWIPLSQVN